MEKQADIKANAEAIKIFCSRLCIDGAEPLTAREWGDLTNALKKRGIQPAELLKYSSGDFFALTENAELAERLLKLTDRGEALYSTLSEYENIGVRTLTRADGDYPARLKKTLGAYCPPVLYCAGDISLLNGKYAGYVGSREATEADRDFTVSTVIKTAGRGYGVVSGGARGVDSISEAEALKQGVAVVEFLADSIKRKMRYGEVYRAVQDGVLALVSAVEPDATFSAKTALMRNRFIYALSEGTVVVHSNLNKGGTWSGATDNLRHGFCSEFCWQNPEYAGNTALIAKGAIPITEDFDGDISGYEPPKQTALF